MTSITVSELREKASALGAAICAATGLGWFDSVEEAAQGMAHHSNDFEPQREASEFYENSYQTYLKRRSDSTWQTG